MVGGCSEREMGSGGRARRIRGCSRVCSEGMHEGAPAGFQVGGGDRPGTKQLL